MHHSYEYTPNLNANSYKILPFAFIEYAVLSIGRVILFPFWSLSFNVWAIILAVKNEVNIKLLQILSKLSLKYYSLDTHY